MRKWLNDHLFRPLWRAGWLTVTSPDGKWRPTITHGEGITYVQAVNARIQTLYDQGVADGYQRGYEVGQRDLFRESMGHAGDAYHDGALDG